MKKIVIIGGGFGGIKTALDLEKQKLPNTKIVLVHNKFHFEYHGALYRTVTGRSPLEVCIPMHEIFKGKHVEVVEDEITGISVKKTEEGVVYTLKNTSKKKIQCDHLVLALGMETNYYDIPGLKEYSFGFKTVNDALRLKKHLHEVFERSSHADVEEQKSACHIVVVGAGASGVEVAGDLSIYTKEVARSHGIDPSNITIDLVEAQDRILPMMSVKFSDRIKKRLIQLGVHIHIGKNVIRVDANNVYLKDMPLKTKTVIWTAGVKAHQLYAQLKIGSCDKRGRVKVDEYFQPEGIENMHIIGDGASTRKTGMAQTALADAQYVARIIGSRIIQKKDLTIRPYEVKEIIYPIPVGSQWAGVLWGKRMLFGRLGWFVRRCFDMKVFLMFLSLGKAVQAFRESGVVCETCEKCSQEK